MGALLATAEILAAIEVVKTDTADKFRSGFF